MRSILYSKFIPGAIAFFLLVTLQLISAKLSAQSPINPNAWNGNTGSASPAGFTSFPAMTTPGTAACNFSTWQRNGSLGDGTGGSFNSNNWVVGGSLASAQAANADVSFTVTNNGTTELKITSFFIMSQVSATGPHNVQLEYAIGAGPDVPFGGTIATAHTASPENWTIAGSVCIGAGKTAKFKLYGWGATGTAGTLRINNGTSVTATYATVTGALTAVPTNSSPVCVGSLLTFTGTVTGGLPAYTYSWSGPAAFTSTLQNPSILSATPPAAGTYTLTVTDIMTCTATGNTTVTVNPAAAPISGATSVCVGATTTLVDAGGGTWSSSVPAIASVGSSTGVVTGVSIGTSVITYTLPGGCFTTVTVTVNPSPSVISGSSSVCAGSTAALTASGAGAWSSSNIAIADVGSLSGIVSGISAGTAVITFTLTGGCYSTFNMTVNPAPASISGTANVCAGGTTLLTDAGGGTWTSSTPSVATVGSLTGLVNGISAGTATITYSLPSGCYSVLPVTVNAAPAAISGTATVCVGFTTLLSDAGGGTWLSSNLPVATIGSSSGLVSGISAGFSVITYSLPTGCYTTVIVTVNANPAAISGSPAVCQGATTTLSDAGGGTWSSSNALIASVGPLSGVVTGVLAGTAVITYTLPGGCYTTLPVTVNPSPALISGASAVCVGATTILSDSGPGTWSSSNPGVASIGSLSGIVTGITAGTATITFTLPAGCFTTLAFTVNPAASVIAGPSMVCFGSTITLVDAGGGTWSSSNPSVAPVGPLSGIVSGLSVGTATITYTLPAGCFATANVTVNPTPAAISGSSTVCVGATDVLTDAGGGTWTSTSPLIASIGSATGIVSGLTPGTTIIGYALPGGCFTTMSLTVNPLPAPISGLPVLCVGGTTTLTDAGGGSWSSSNPAIAGVGALTGVVTGMSAGVATITYALPTGCTAWLTVTVNLSATPISGATTVCVGYSTTLTDAGTGTWSSSNPAIAVVGTASGVVTGVAAGIVNITFTLPSGCFSTVLFTVNPTPAPITGTAVVCQGLTTILSDVSGPGTWTSSNLPVANVGTSSGAVSGISGGLSVISFTLSDGCFAIRTVTVNPAPATISGPSSVCLGASIVLSDAGGGTWSSSSPSVASVGPFSGVVNGLLAGAATITYTLPTGCLVTTPITVNSLPSAITGVAVVCAGSTTTLSDIGPGTWSSSNANATVDASTGVVTGVAAGTSVITFTPPTGCIATRIVTINPLPAPISGTPYVCIGLTTTLTDAGTGAWSSSNTNATIGTSSGIVTGAAIGTSVITYTLPTGCLITLNFTVNPLPAPFTGSIPVCVGSAITLSDTGTGTWSSSNLAVATIGSASGVLTGQSIGTTIITYRVSATGCLATAAVNVGGITGAGHVCDGSAVTLAATFPGGAWTSGNISIATIDTTSGLLTGVSMGTVIVTYDLGTGCHTTWPVTVYPAAPILGVDSVCVGSVRFLTDIVGGGHWVSSFPGIASVAADSGLVTGHLPGITTISYVLPTGCVNAVTFNVVAYPAAITGAMRACPGISTTLADTVAGGFWTSVNLLVATVDSFSGSVTGVAVDTVDIYYTISPGCSARARVTINPLPAPIVGDSILCPGKTDTLTDATPWGYWSAMSPAIATVDTYGVVTALLAAGPAYIRYTLPSTGCYQTKIVTVNPLPVPAITYNPLDQTFYASPGYAHYQWYDSTLGLIHGATAPNVAAAQSSYYYVVVTDSSGCMGASPSYFFDITKVQVDNELKNSLVRVYPNPANSTVFIESDLNLKAVVYSLNGVVVLEQKDARVIDISQVAKGIYLIALFDTDGNRVAVKTLVKE